MPRSTSRPRGSNAPAISSAEGGRPGHGELIRTTKGTGGGSYVTLPTVDHISEFLRASLVVLSEAERVSLGDLLEVRELVEVPAARLAAQRSTGDDVRRLRESIPENSIRITTQEQLPTTRASTP